VKRIDVRAAVRVLGITITSESDTELIGLCPLHDDHHPSFAINQQTGAWVCYTGCGQGGILTLAQRVLGCSYQTAQYYLDSKVVSAMPEAPTLTIGAEKEVVGPPEFHYVEGKTHRYMIERGFTPDTLRDWHVGWDFARQAIVIPVTWQGDTVGLIYRHVPPIPEGYPRYEYTPHMPKSRILFGWDHIDWAADAPLIMVEGPLDALMMHQYGFRTTAAILGMSMSKAQAELLNARSLRVTLCFDQDEAGRDATKRGIKLLHGRAGVVKLPHKDPAECTREEVAEALATVSTLWVPPHA